MNDNIPLLTFIIPTIGRPTLKRTIKSLEQLNNKNWNAIVIFDGISPNLQIKDERIKIMMIEKIGKIMINNETHNSAGLVRNKGIENVKTEWIGFVDDDDIILPTYLDDFYNHLSKNNPDVIIFRMNDKDIILPPLESTDFEICKVGISFCLKTSLIKNENFWFINSQFEDFHLLYRLRECQKKIIISEKINYIVRPIILEYSLPIYYINLDHRLDRKELIEKELNEYKLSFERFSAIKNSFGILGCSKSHLSLLKYAKEQNFERILILEDDFTFLVSKEEFYNEINQLLCVDFDVCMISYNTKILKDSEYPFLKKVIDSQTMSGYIVNKHYYDILIECLEKSNYYLEKTRIVSIYACDISIKELQKKDNWYQTTIRLGKQRESYSNIENKNVNYNL
jgi:GR25 family glycosyltransferase involved in LPS biosynthesis